MAIHKLQGSDSDSASEMKSILTRNETTSINSGFPEFSKETKDRCTNYTKWAFQFKVCAKYMLKIKLLK